MVIAIAILLICSIFEEFHCVKGMPILDSEYSLLVVQVYEMSEKGENLVTTSLFI